MLMHTLHSPRALSNAAELQGIQIQDSVYFYAWCSLKL